MPQTQDSPSLVRPAGLPRYDSVLVHVERDKVSTRRTEVAVEVARSFGARLIGLGAESIEPIPPADPYGGLMTAEWVAAMQKQVSEDLASAEAAFARDATGVETEWRCVQDMPARALAGAAEAADLIVAGGTAPALGDDSRCADVAEVVLRAGRPVLVAPAEPAKLSGKAVIVAWKDTRESRRAVADALPFLARAEQVVVMAVCAEDEVETAKAHAEDVAATLRRRGVKARAHVVTAPEASVAEELNAEAAAIGADLIVAGAYGHTRLAEWVCGGVTRELLRRPQRFLLLSH